MRRSLLILSILLFVFSACEKQNIKRAEKSLAGNWTVTKIYTAYGEKMELGTQTNKEFTEEGDLGTFAFNKSTVDYNYTRLDTLNESNNDWELIREKVNAGFTNAEQYILIIDTTKYICRFGDETKDAEKKATDIILEYETTAIGPYTSIMFWLEKQ